MLQGKFSNGLDECYHPMHKSRVSSNGNLLIVRSFNFMNEYEGNCGIECIQFNFCPNCNQCIVLTQMNTIDLSLERRNITACMGLITATPHLRIAVS